MWRYTIAVLVLWVINPELRRLYDWRFGYSPVELLSLLPLLALIPHFWSLTVCGGWRRLPRLLMVPAWLWLGGFAYALVLAILNGNVLPGSYELANFVLPLTVGLWIASDATPFATAYQRVTRVLFGLTTIISVYGIIQYVTAPPWDALWLHNMIEQGSLSFGRPYPFAIRVFSTLNSPAPFGNFVSVMLLLALPQLSLRRPGLLTQVPLWLIAFGLSLDRSGWLVFAGGVVFYLVFTPHRGALLVTAGLTIAMLAGLIVILPAAVGNDSMLTGLSERLDTLSNLDSDPSGKERAVLYDQGPELVATAPFGRGLGVLGPSTKLSDAATTTDFDSGLLARFVEMGVPGASLFIAALALLFRASFSVWNDARLVKDWNINSVCAAALAIEAGLVGLLISGDLGGLLVLVLWLAVCLAVRGHPQSHADQLMLVAA